ncbi:MAG: tetratricopeptide repeat protein [Saprospiraceae bacterium]
MTKPQYVAMLGALALFCVLYLGFGTVAADQKRVEHSRTVQQTGLAFESLLDEAKAHLTEKQAADLLRLEQNTSAAGSDTEKIESLKRLSGWWYAEGHPEIAGGVAEQAAQLAQTDEAWSVAGATFYEALVVSENPKVREFCAAHAVNAFESAASLNPNNVEHRVNLALVFAENPSADDPMKAVKQLRELEAQHPDNAAVYNALGRLAIKTGQWERAVQRLEKAWSLNPKNANTPCLLARAYEGLGNADKTKEYQSLCR